MNKLVLGLIGQRLAGKDSAAEHLANKYGALHLKFSQLLDEILKILNLPISRRNEIDLGLGLRSVFGKSVLGPAIFKRAQTATEKLIVISGIRMDEIKDLETLNPILIYISAPPETRFERYLKRHEKADDGVMNFEQFQAQEQELTEIGIPELAKQAKFNIENTGSLSDLHQKLDQLIGNLK
jgi:dephospho-CoA kinase